MSDATVIIGPWENKVVPIVPRSTFGQRKTPVLGDLPGALNAALGIARADDKAQQENFKRIARDLRGATASAVCPSLLKAKAGHAEGLSQALRALAAECTALGAIKQANTFSDAADLVELAGAELEA